jgi:hypothetical protein
MLKNSIRSPSWFPLDRTAAAEIAKHLPDGAFKLVILLGMSAEVPAGIVKTDFATLAADLQKDIRAIAADMNLLAEKRCVSFEANRKGRIEISICGRLWPYDRPAASVGEAASDAYIDAIISFLECWDCVCNARSRHNRLVAAEFFQSGIDLETVRHGILLAVARKYMQLAHKPDAGPICSLRYVECLINRRETAKPEYWEYLERRLNKYQERQRQRAAVQDRSALPAKPETRLSGA